MTHEQIRKAAAKRAMRAWQEREEQERKERDKEEKQIEKENENKLETVMMKDQNDRSTVRGRKLETDRVHAKIAAHIWTLITLFGVVLLCLVEASSPQTLEPYLTTQFKDVT